MPGELGPGAWSEVQDTLEGDSRSSKKVHISQAGLAQVTAVTLNQAHQSYQEDSTYFYHFPKVSIQRQILQNSLTSSISIEVVTSPNVTKKWSQDETLNILGSWPARTNTFNM